MNTQQQPQCKRVPAKGACGFCAKVRRIQSRGLCRPCWDDPAIRELFPAKAHGPGFEPSQEQVDRTVAEQFANLPAWWEKDKRRQAGV